MKYLSSDLLPNGMNTSGSPPWPMPSWTAFSLTRTASNSRANRSVKNHPQTLPKIRYLYRIKSHRVRGGSNHYRNGWVKRIWNIHLYDPYWTCEDDTWAIPKAERMWKSITENYLSLWIVHRPRRTQLVYFSSLNKCDLFSHRVTIFTPWDVFIFIQRLVLLFLLLPFLLLWPKWSFTTKEKCNPEGADREDAK